MEINPNWFEDLILFLAIYILAVGSLLLIFWWRAYRWWNKLEDKDED